MDIFFKAPPPGVKPVKAAQLYTDTADGGTLSRPIQPTDVPDAPLNNQVQQYLNSNWGGTTEPSVQLPWAFSAAIIGPRSHFAYVCIQVPGRKPFVIGPGKPIIGSFPANTLMFPFYRIGGVGGLLEVLFWPNEPNSEFPGGRTPLSRQIVGGVNINPEVDSTFSIANPWNFICENRIELNITGLPTIGSTQCLVPVWTSQPPYNFENPSKASTQNGVGYIDTLIAPNRAMVDLSQGVFNITWPVPAGATRVFMQDQTTGTIFSETGNYNITLSGERAI